jgi:hypothetical protein
MCIAASVQIIYCHFQAPTLGAYQIKLVLTHQCESNYECNRMPKFVMCRHVARANASPLNCHLQRFVPCSSCAALFSFTRVMPAFLPDPFRPPRVEFFPSAVFQRIPGIQDALCLSRFEEPWARCSACDGNWSPALTTTTSKAWCVFSPRKGCVGLRFDVMVLMYLCSFA